MARALLWLMLLVVTRSAQSSIWRARPAAQRAASVASAGGHAPPAVIIGRAGECWPSCACHRRSGHSRQPSGSRWRLNSTSCGNEKPLPAVVCGLLFWATCGRGARACSTGAQARCRRRCRELEEVEPTRWKLLALWAEELILPTLRAEIRVIDGRGLHDFEVEEAWRSYMTR
jgi:hypothetical protein